MTDTQHGAKSATTPARKAAATEVLNKSEDKWILRITIVVSTTKIVASIHRPLARRL